MLQQHMSKKKTQGGQIMSPPQKILRRKNNPLKTDIKRDYRLLNEEVHPQDTPGDEEYCKVHNFHCCICSGSVSLYYSIYNRSLVGFCGWFTSYIVLANYYVNHLYLTTP